MMYLWGLPADVVIFAEGCHFLLGAGVVAVMARYVMPRVWGVQSLPLWVVLCGAIGGVLIDVDHLLYLVTGGVFPWALFHHPAVYGLCGVGIWYGVTRKNYWVWALALGALSHLVVDKVQPWF